VSFIISLYIYVATCPAFNGRALTKEPRTVLNNNL
jgi:hypothetical protein